MLEIDLGKALANFCDGLSRRVCILDHNKKASAVMMTGPRLFRFWDRIGQLMKHGTKREERG